MAGLDPATQGYKRRCWSPWVAGSGDGHGELGVAPDLPDQLPRHTFPSWTDPSKLMTTPPTPPPARHGWPRCALNLPTAGWTVLWCRIPTSIWANTCRPLPS